MKRNVGLLKLDNKNAYFGKEQTGSKCIECSVPFQKPILATIASLDHVQTYYACPHCLTKVSEIEKREEIEEEIEEIEEIDESVESVTTSLPLKEVKKSVVELEENVECSHFLGYLSKRSKDTPIPEECLTCTKMIDCLH